LFIPSNRKSDLSHGEGIDAIKTTMEAIDLESRATEEAVKDLGIRIQQNSSQLALLDSIVSDSLDNIHASVVRTEWIVRDLEQSMDGRFTLMQTDMRSIESRSLTTSQAVTELLAKVDAFSEQMSTMVGCLRLESLPGPSTPC
jgi:hypothetical protein